jgi:subtilisin family serine protease
VVAVTAVDVRKRVFRQANQGDHIDFAAPGVRIWTAASISGGRFRSGTSYAAPFVSAMLAVARTQHPDDDVPQLVEKLADGAIDLGEPGRDATFGWGLIQAPAACDTPAEEFFPAAMRQ